MEHLQAQDHLCREELRARSLSLWQRLVAEMILDYTVRRGVAAVRICRLDDLADALGTTRGNLHPVLSQLLLYDILRQDERAALWWVNLDFTSWQVRRRTAANAERARRAALADERILQDNPLQPDQRELFEPEQTDAEAQAEAACERAGVSSPSAPPPALADLSASSSAETVIVRSEFHNRRSEIQNSRSEFHNEKPAAAVLNFRTNGRPNAPAYMRARPGQNQANAKPGKPGFGEGQGKAGRGPRRPLSAEAFAVLEELEEWCAQGPEGPDLFEVHRETWEGRLRWKPGLVERALREGQVHVREQRLPPIKRSRGGFVDALFRAWLEPVKQTAAPSPPRGAAAPDAELAAGPPLSWEQKQELARRCREELQKQFGKPTPP